MKRKLFRQVCAIAWSLVIVIFIEGLFTMGSALKFDTYTTFGWVFQGLVVTGTIATALLYVEETNDKS